MGKLQDSWRLRADIRIIKCHALIKELFGVLAMSAAKHPLPILAVEEVAHRPSPGLVRFHQSLAFVGVHAVLG